MISPAAPRGPRQHVTAGVASMVGTTIEWYDFFLYGTAAALIFNKVFFPAFDPLTGTLAAFGTYAVGFLARPLGAVVFGHYGDRVGRKSMLLVTLFLMGIPTTLIGLIPSYESIGYGAAVLLVLMRFLQGMAVGGEWGGAVLMAVEHAPAGRRGFFGSLPQAGVGAGLILSSLAMAAVTQLPEADLLSWGWRLPFLASVVLLGVGAFIRFKVQESPDFEILKASGRQVELPVLEVIRRYPRVVLTAAGARMAETTWFYTVVTFSLTYITQQLGMPKAQALDAIVIGATVSLFTIPLAGWLCDQVGARRVFMGGAALLCLAAFAFFELLATKDPRLLVLAMSLAIGGIFPLLYAPQSALFSAQFPPEIRYSGISVSVQLAGAVAGGAAPLVATALLAAGDGDPWMISVYLVALGVLALFCGSLLRKEH
ncbi:MAG: transporter [Moraxellaceae bacterium]|jgi:metabolite-proton symporter|nr:transporter [Moraxellaceae bacterium]